jgi:hypothetical protein
MHNLDNNNSNNKKKVNLSLCLTNQALRHEGVRGSGCIDLRILDLGSSWKLPL